MLNRHRLLNFLTSLIISLLPYTATGQTNLPLYEVVMDENDFPQLRKVIRCDRFVGKDAAKSAVLLTFGQSNAGNHGGSRFIGRYGVVNFDFRTGKCYHAEDPLIG